MEAESSQQPPAPAPPTLDYAKRPALAWVSRHRRLLIFLALCLAIAGPTWWYWQPLKHRALWLYWFHQAAAHRMPAKSIDLVIDDPAKAKLAAAENPDYLPYNYGSSRGTQRQGANYIPTIYRELLKYDPRLNLSATPGQPVAFIGTLKRPDGTLRLVIVMGSGGITGNLLQGISVLVLPLPTFTDPIPLAVYSNAPKLTAFIGQPPTPTRLRSGVVDSADPSHINFDFEAGPKNSYFSSFISPNTPTPWTISGTGVIDARLQNDDSIAFTLPSITGDDPNIRVGTAKMAGDVQTLQADAQRRQQMFSRASTAPATAASRSGRSERANGR